MQVAQAAGHRTGMAGQRHRQGKIGRGPVGKMEFDNALLRQLGPIRSLSSVGKAARFLMWSVLLLTNLDPFHGSHFPGF